MCKNKTCHEDIRKERGAERRPALLFIDCMAMLLFNDHLVVYGLIGLYPHVISTWCKAV